MGTFLGNSPWGSGQYPSANMGTKLPPTRSLSRTAKLSNQNKLGWWFTTQFPKALQNSVSHLIRMCYSLSYKWGRSFHQFKNVCKAGAANKAVGYGPFYHVHVHQRCWTMCKFSLSKFNIAVAWFICFCRYMLITRHSLVTFLLFSQSVQVMWRNATTFSYNKDVLIYSFSLFDLFPSTNVHLRIKGERRSCRTVTRPAIIISQLFLLFNAKDPF